MDLGVNTNEHLERNRSLSEVPHDSEQELEHLCTCCKLDLLLSVLCAATPMIYFMCTLMFLSPHYFSIAGIQVASLVRFLIENAPSIFGNEAEDAFTMLLKTEQENDDLTGQDFYLFGFILCYFIFI